MSRQEVDYCTSPDQATPSDTTMPSSSRASSSSNPDENSVADVSSDHPISLPPQSVSSSSSQISLLQCDVQPRTDGLADSSGSSTPDVDPQILEALRSKDRLFVLKLSEQMEALIKERHSRSKIHLLPENQYQRLLVHRCAAYYKLTFENEPTARDKSSTRDMAVLVTIESKIPPRRISELVPAEQTAHPTFKIMRRSEQDRRRQKTSISRPGSIAGEDAELSDPGPSETGSMCSRSTTSKKRMTIAEREAAYQEARSRIFMDFEEKEKAKERDTSASSSTFSLISASGSGSQSGGAGGSISDIDDNASTAPTESEWSIPLTDVGRGGGDSGMSSASSTRSFHSVTPSFNGHVGERPSGTASPAITYPSLYDPSAHAPVYDHAGYMTPPGGYMTSPYSMYGYPHPPHGVAQVPAPGSYLAPYPYYHPQYPYGPPHLHPHSSSDPTSPVATPIDSYSHHSAAMPYMGPSPYGWMPPHAANHQHHHSSLENHTSPASGSHQVHTPPVQGAHPLPYPAHQYPYMAPPGPVSYGGYPPYFQPPPQTHPPLVHPNSQPIYPIELPPINGHAPDQNTSSGMSNGNGSPSPTLSRHSNSSGNSNGHHHMSGNGSKRGPTPARNAWSYGPGIGLHTSTPGSGMHFGSSGNGGESVGPRLSSAIRRTSGASSSSSANKMQGDETASTISSSASSTSSQRTFTPTTSKHPLPARPDWAAGMKAQPTLHPPTRARHDSNNNSRNMSPARPHQQQNHHQSQQPAPQQLEPIFLQATDFPPLSSISNTPADRRPTVGGAWSNPSPAARAILPPNSGPASHTPGNTYGTALFNHNMPNGAGVANRLEDDERGFERPPPKTSAELFNPKSGAKRSTIPIPTQAPFQDKTEKEEIEKERARGEIVASAILADKVASVKLQDQSDGNEREASAYSNGDLRELPHESLASSSSTLFAGAGESVDGGGVRDETIAATASAGSS
ncbi:hypothetical protein M0805_006663 [Coniferiporia weirii]|nr:hypothetical protein M0805_006663 [Coniferiporia weirii]